MTTKTPTAFAHRTLHMAVDAMAETLEELRRLADSLTTEAEIVTWREVVLQAEQILGACARMTALASEALAPSMKWLRAHARETQREIDELDRLFMIPPTEARSHRA